MLPANQTITETLLKHLRSVYTNSHECLSQYKAIKTILTPNQQYLFFAEPSIKGDTIHWMTEAQGVSKPFAEHTPEEQIVLRRILRFHVMEIQETLKRYQNAKQLSDWLTLWIEIPCTENLYFFGERPIVANWSFNFTKLGSDESIVYNLIKGLADIDIDFYIEVFDINGNAVPDAHISLQLPNYLQQGITNNEGKYLFKKVPLFHPKVQAKITAEHPCFEKIEADYQYPVSFDILSSKTYTQVDITYTFRTNGNIYNYKPIEDRIQTAKEAWQNILQMENAQALHDAQIDIALVLDKSGSMTDLYKKGIIQDTIERVFGIAANLTEEEIADTWIYADRCARVAPIERINLRGFVRTVIMPTKIEGGNNELPIVQAIVKTYITDLPAPNKNRLVLFMTDGGFDSKAISLIKDIFATNVHKPMFWQFVGIGKANYEYLSSLSSVPNVGFSHLDDLAKITDKELYERLLTPKLIHWLNKK